MAERKLVQKLFDMFQVTPSGDVAVRTISVTPIPIFGQVKIVSSGTAIQLGAGGLSNGIILQAKSTNTANLLLGGSSVTRGEDGSGNGFILEPGNSITFAAENANDIYVNGASGDILSYAGS